MKHGAIRSISTARERSHVHPGLVDSLLATEPTVHNPIATHVCAALSGWAYADEPAAATLKVLARLGLEGAQCEEISLHNDAMLVASTAFLIQSACGRVAILCYRGTEPRNAMNWMTDLDVNPTRVRIHIGADQEALVHGGFCRNLHATWYEVARGLHRALIGRPVNRHHHESLQPLEALFITGHSLGAAMASMATIYLATDPVQQRHFRSKLRGTYTFGQPMIGSPELAAACMNDPLLRDGVFRHGYANDIVPHVPAVQSGKFEHFGREFHATEGTGWAERRDYAKQAPTIVMSTFVIPTLAFWGKQLASTRDLLQFGYSWYDHLPPFYVQASTPPGVASEFERRG